MQPWQVAPPRSGVSSASRRKSRFARQVEGAGRVPVYPLSSLHLHSSPRPALAARPPQHASYALLMYDPDKQKERPKLPSSPLSDTVL